jgi:hypothetical protein
MFAPFVLILFVGCGQTENPTGATTTHPDMPPSEAGKKLLLSDAPKSLQEVIQARETAKDGQDVVVVGRIGGDVNPWVEGRAAFTIVDPSLVPCNEKPGDSCTTPWDYCCDTDRLPKSKATVKFVDEQGKTLTTDARKLLGLKELQTVVVRGKAKRDDAGNLTVVASGLFVQPSAPKIPATEKHK